MIYTLLSGLWTAILMTSDESNQCLAMLSLLLYAIMGSSITSNDSMIGANNILVSSLLYAIMRDSEQTLCGS